MDFKNNRLEDEENVYPSMLKTGFKVNYSSRKILRILVGIGFLAVIVLIFLAKTGNDKGNMPPMNSTDPSALISQDHEKRITSLNRRLTEIESSLIKGPELVQRIDDIGARGLENKNSIQEIQSSIATLEKQLEEIKSAMEKSAASAPVAKDAEPKQSPARSETIKYHEVKKGDTLYSIARNNGIALDEFLRINDLSESAVIRPGDRLVVE